MATVAITNNGDGTVQAVVSGATGVWTLYAVNANDLGSDSWAVVASGSGNGTASAISISSVGAWLFYILNAGTISTPTYCVVSSLENETWFQCLTAIAGRICLLGLEGVDPQRVNARKQPLDSYLAKVISAAQLPGKVDASPAILVTPTPEVKANKQYNGLRRVEYGCRVSFFIGNDYNPGKWLDRQLLWRRRVSDQFDQQSLPEVSGIELCWVVPGDVFPMQHFALGYDVQGLDIRCRACHAI